MGGRMSAAFRVVGTCPVVGVVTAPPLSLRAVLCKSKPCCAGALLLLCW